MKLLLIALSIILLTGCSTVSKILPEDKRDVYKKSEPLPDLEVPPDLTAAAGNQAMNIPGETEASLIDYQQQQSQKNGTAPVVQQPVDSGNDNFVVVNGTSTEIWPRLRQFFREKGYTFDLDNADMGVLGTEWAETGNQQRIRYKVFSESGAEPGLLVLFISNELQQMVNNTWTDTGKDLAAERLTAGELNLYFSNNVAAFTPEPDEAGLTFERTTDGTILYLPHEYTYAWAETEKALQRSGLVINKSNQSQGIYTVAYYDDSVPEKEEGFVSKLAFWRKDKKRPEGTLYNISLTGAGHETELIILNEEGAWENSSTADRIIQLIIEQYDQ